MPKFRKKPVVIEAFVLGLNESPQWFMDKIADGTITAQTRKSCLIETLEGVMRANNGDYIIKGVRGEIYPCDPDIFEETYEQVLDCYPLEEEWFPVENPPAEGIIVVGDFADGEELIEYRSERQCMLSSVAQGAGQVGAGWVSVDAGYLPIDPPKRWRHMQSALKDAIEGKI